jgi:hypothetical protein
MTTSAPPRPPRTRSGLLPDARHVVLPDGIVASGFPAVEATCAQIGIEFDPWQADLNRCILAKDRWKLYAADTAVISICRQAGKTYDIGAIAFALCIIHPGTTVVWTAHRFKVARESFNELRSWAKSPRLVPHIEYDDITTAAGNECIPFRNGSRIVFAARERGAIRGFTKVRMLVLDEAQILTEAAMSDLVPTTNQAENPLIILMGTPPKPSDPGEVFTALRTAALAGDSEGVLYVEFSAPPDCESDDWEAVKIANPSFPARTSKRAILRLRKLLTNDDDYRREGLGIWDEDSRLSVLPRWKKRVTDEEPPTPAAIGVAVSLDLEWGSIGAAGAWPEDPGEAPEAEPTDSEVPPGRVHVGAVDRRPGTTWLVAEAKRIQDERGCIVAMDEKCPDGELREALENAGVRVTTLNLNEYHQACSAMVNRSKDGRVTHSDTPELNDAIKNAAWRMVGDRKVFGRKQSVGDISMLEACTVAAWAVPRAYDPMSNIY